MLIVRGQYVWTETELLHDAAVVCVDGRIQEIGNAAPILTKYPQATVVGGPDAIVLPGFVNPHHHGNGVTSFLRGVADDALEPWLAALSTAPSPDPYLDTLWAAAALLKGGYTTVGLFQSTSDPAQAKHEAVARIKACRHAGLRVAFGLDLMQQNAYVYGPDPAGFPPFQGLETEAYLDLLLALRAEFASDPGVSVFAAPSGPQWVTEAAWQRIGSWTKDQRMPLHTHCLESPYEAEYARRSYGGSAVVYLDRLGALHEYTALVHGVYLDEAELALMSKRGASLITNPSSNLRLRCGVSPVLKALSRGVRVALANDSCTLGEHDDAFAEMRLLFYLHREPGMNSPALEWHQVLRMATQTAASVTPWRDEIGVISPGKFADLAVYNLAAASRPWVHPDLDPRQILLQRANKNHLQTVIVEGRIVYDAERGLTLVNEDDIARAIQEDMAKRPFPPRDSRLAAIVRQYYESWPVPKRTT